MIYTENILLCVAIPLCIGCFFLHENARQLGLSVLMGMIASLLASYISSFIGYSSGMNANDTAVFISPVTEELLKSIPVLLYLLLFLPNDADLFSVAVGLGVGFATFENCCYILGSGSERLIYILIRGMAVGVMHIVSMLVLTFGMILMRRFRAITLSGVIGALSVSMIYHAMYNLLVSEPGVTSWIGYIFPILTAVFLYPVYKKIRESFDFLKSLKDRPSL